MAQCDTVQIEHPDGKDKGTIRINKSDFDAKVHKIARAAAKRPVSRPAAESSAKKE